MENFAVGRHGPMGGAWREARVSRRQCNRNISGWLWRWSELGLGHLPFKISVANLPLDTNTDIVISDKHLAVGLSGRIPAQKEVN